MIGRWALRLLVAWLVLTVVPVVLLRFIDPPTTAFMFERRMAAARAGDSRFQLQYHFVPRSRISPHLVRALVAAEDAKFLEHHGFDWDAMAEAMEDRIEGKSKRGGSTLTQQVAKNLFLWPARSYVRKLLEAYFTVLIEVFWSKQRIIEMHLNIAEYGDGVYGVEMASRRFFGKSAAAVTPQEASELVVVLPAPKSRRPNALNGKSLERAAWVREQVGNLTPERIEGL
ncbi:MAG: monofunctional biosynthetic peptidoglycan transglycosylase [Archangium sp.]|nr:monofunctional biosynthetic peptidoglycan transglycosylase [Archangium sp.]